MRTALLRRLIGLYAARHSYEVGPPTSRTPRIYANRAERRARVDEDEAVPPELARRPPLSDGDGGV